MATAWIYDNQRVVYDMFAHQMGPIWLMLASSASFQAAKDGLVDPAVMLGLFETITTTSARSSSRPNGCCNRNSSGCRWQSLTWTTEK